MRKKYVFLGLGVMFVTAVLLLGLVSAGEVELVRSNVTYTDIVEPGGMLWLNWSTDTSNEYFARTITNIPPEFEVIEENISVVCNKEIEAVVYPDRVGIKSKTAVTGIVLCNTSIRIPDNCPVGNYSIGLSEMVGADMMLEPKMINVNITAVPTVLSGISVNKVANPSAAASSSNVEFTITVTNTGECRLDPIGVVDTLPVWMSYLSSSPASDTHDGAIIWDSVGPLDPGASKTITLVAHVEEGATGTLTNAVTVTATSPTGEEVTDSDTVTVTVLAKTIVPPTKALIDITTEIKSDETVIEDGQFGWGSGNRNLHSNERMIGLNGTTELEKVSGVNTHVTPKLVVTKDIGYKSGDLGSLSHDEQVGMSKKCKEVNAYSEMVVTDVGATIETEVGRDLLYEIDAEGNGTAAAGVDAFIETRASRISYKDKSIAYGGNFSFQKRIGSKPP